MAAQALPDGFRHGRQNPGAHRRRDQLRVGERARHGVDVRGMQRADAVNGFHSLAVARKNPDRVPPKGVQLRDDLVDHINEGDIITMAPQDVADQAAADVPGAELNRPSH